MTITDADRLAYDNSPQLQLRNPDQKLLLHYGYGGLRRIEKHFGSIQGLTDKLEQGAEGELFTAVFMGLFCGLWKTGITEQALEERLDPADLEQHAQVLGEALAAAFPKQVQASNAEAVESPSVSTGPASTTSQVSYVDAPTSSSGT